ncbi:ABC transporter permease [uncultured Paludibaculum sp.]|uniref:ABC transporter permease n=1 Tax=uncultured Paludibaculum sp. TaxID=1765020 RepID=UPI002AAAC915|nr:ABC transporter permease [uncultured Paludibaculum sp.]
MLPEELRYSLRSLRRARGLTVTSILTVALGVGAGTSLFGVVKAVLLNPLPYPDPGRLAWVASVSNDRHEMRTSLPDFDDWRRQTRAFSQMGVYGEGPLLVGGGQVPQRSFGAVVSEEFFETLGVRPALGRVLSAEDHRHGGPLSTVVIGHGLWQRAYGADQAILGRQITVLGQKSTVIGVMPQGFAFPAGAEVWGSIRTLGEGDSRTAHNYWAVGRLRPGVTVEAAHREISAAARGLKQQFPDPFQTPDASVQLLTSHLVGSVRTPLLMLFAAVGLLLLIVCVNVANLLLVRVTARSRELTVHAAVGAQRWHLFRRLLIESLLLASAGGILGLLTASWSMDLLRVLLPAEVPRAADVRIDTGVVLVAVAFAALAGALFGILPAWRASQLNIHDILRSGSRGPVATRRSQRVQAALLVSEVALSTVLLAGAGLLLSSYARLKAVDPGFRPAGVLAVDLSWPVNDADRARLDSSYRRLLDRVRAMPGVEAAGTINDLPLDPIQRDGHFFIESRRDLRALDAGYLIVSPGLLETLGIPLLRGRRLTDSDSGEAPGVAIVNAEMARTFWPGRDPVGDRIWYDSFEPKEHWLTIIGVSSNVRQAGLTQPARPEAYVCYSQIQMKGQLGSGNLMVRSKGDPRRLAPALRTVIREVNPEAGVNFRTMDDVLADATSRQRFQLQVLGAFAALALILAAVGLYGVLSYTVTSNRAAIGVRIALGARPVEIFRMVARRALSMTVTGAAIGLACCLTVRGILQKVVFGIGPSDPAMLAAATAVMVGVALAACWFPARRAMLTDPAVSLREE